MERGGRVGVHRQGVSKVKTTNVIAQDQGWRWGRIRREASAGTATASPRPRDQRRRLWHDHCCSRNAARLARYEVNNCVALRVVGGRGGGPAGARTSTSRSSTRPRTAPSVCSWTTTCLRAPTSRTGCTTPTTSSTPSGPRPCATCTWPGTRRRGSTTTFIPPDGRSDYASASSKPRNTRRRGRDVAEGVKSASERDMFGGDGGGVVRSLLSSALR